MANNAEFGLTVQKVICEKYGIQPNQYARAQFKSSYNVQFRAIAEKIVVKLFDELKLNPIVCQTFSESQKTNETLCPHNFVLSNGETLSIRTNKKGDKIAPRVVGQCGIGTFNDHFADIVGYEIQNKDQIKQAVFDKIHLMMPEFIEYLFLSDYTAWIRLIEENNFRIDIIDKHYLVDIALERNKFSFTRDLSLWNESTTLKYNGKSIAEIQIHKNRTFKFRFIMGTLLELLVEQKTTTETLGISAEKAICDLGNLPVPLEYRNRYSPKLVNEIRPILDKAFLHLPRPIKSTGAAQGDRGASSKCSYDFILEGKKTLSLKTNLGNMVCPPEVGQPSAETCYLYFKDFFDNSEVTPDSFKRMVLTHIEDIMPIYVEHLFDSDYLLWLYKSGDHFEYKVYESDCAKKIEWRSNRFSFTKSTVEEWNESNTVKYKGFSIGEFQVHKHRSCYKFRFNMEKLDQLIRTGFVNDEQAAD